MKWHQIKAIRHCNVIAMNPHPHLKRDHGCALWTRFLAFVYGISSLCGKEISVFTLCRDSDVDGAWQEEEQRDLIRPRLFLSKVFPGRVHHHGRLDHHHDQDDDHDDHQT